MEKSHDPDEDCQRVGQIPLSFQPPVVNSFPDSCQQLPHFADVVHDEVDDDDDVDGVNGDKSFCHHLGDIGQLNGEIDQTFPES